MPRSAAMTFRVTSMPVGTAADQARARQRVLALLRGFAADLDDRVPTPGSSALEAHPPEPAQGRSTNRSR